MRRGVRLGLMLVIAAKAEQMDDVAVGRLIIPSGAGTAFPAFSGANSGDLGRGVAQLGSGRERH
jgi:hypothetical protein